MGFQRNTRKLKENLAFSLFGAARGHASESFFGDFSLLGALWSMSGRALATLGRSVSALGFSLAPWMTTFGDFGVLFGGFPPDAQSDNYPALAGAAGWRLTRFWSPMTIGNQPKVDGEGQNAVCHGLSAKYTKTKGKT